MSPTRDRLSEMRKIQTGSNSLPEKADGSGNSKRLHKAFEKAESIRENTEIIKNNTAKANDILKNNVFKITKTLQDQLDSLFQVTTSTAYKINSSLKEFENDLNKMQDLESAEFRIKQVQYTTLKYDFHEALRESSTCLEFHKNNRKELLKKSLKTAHRHVNEEELETLLNENKLDVFTDNVLITEAEARQQLSDIEERHQELLKIEKHLNEVLDLFIKVATLVEQQHESVDRVEYHAANASGFVEHGTTEIEKTVRTKRKHTKRKTYIILITVIVILSVVLIIVLV